MFVLMQDEVPAFCRKKVVLIFVISEKLELTGQNCPAKMNGSIVALVNWIRSKFNSLENALGLVDELTAVLEHGANLYRKGMRKFQI